MAALDHLCVYVSKWCRQQLCGTGELMPVLGEFQEGLLNPGLVLGAVEGVCVGLGLPAVLEYTFGFIST